MKIIDLTHTFKKDMPVFPGDEKPRLSKDSSFDTHGYQGFRLNTGMHVGTHIDAPLHMIPGGRTLAYFKPEKFIGPGILIDTRGKKIIDAALIRKKKISPGSIILIRTDLSKKFHTAAYYKNYPVITENFAKEVIRLKAKIVGIDFPSPDREPFRVHKLLLGKEILIIENLTNLAQLARVKKFTVLALPMKIALEAAPVRIIAII